MELGSSDLQNEIQQIRRIVAENNAMLISIQRRARMSIVFSTLKWMFLIGLSFGALYYIKPYIETAMGAYDSVKDLILPSKK